MKKLLVLALWIPVITQAQIPDHVYDPNIRTVKLHKYGDIYSYPILPLNGGDQLELHFDDLAADVKNYYFSFQLCNADWTPSTLQSFDYVKGFQSTRITTYRNSSISLTPYTHYQAIFPDRNSIPTRSGNYLLKVFLNNDTSQLIFTKRFLVVDTKVSISAQLKQPFSAQLFRTDQRIQVGMSTANSRINTLSPQDFRVVVLQNNAWPTATMIDRPTIYRGNYYEYSDDALSFPAGREWRWVDIRSLRLRSDRVRRIIDTADRTEVFVAADVERSGQIDIYYRDLNGIYTVENMDGNNPYWQSDYAYVHFAFVPPGNQPYAGKDVYIFGELTNYSTDESAKMTFNEESGAYEGTLFLKQGYYNYSYITRDAKNPINDRFSFASTEGSFNSTENNYTVLVYFRGFGARSDELIGLAQVNSMN